MSQDSQGHWPCWEQVPLNSFRSVQLRDLRRPNAIVSPVDRGARHLSRLTASKSLSEKLLWYVASILCELLKDGLMQPDVHLGRIAHLVLGTSEFGRKPLSRLEAAIQAQELEQIHN